MASSDAGKYTYNIERLTFRNKASIKLPKTGGANILNRETCYKIAVDIVIESITKPDFRNFKTTPYHGFYGYATLVMRDCIAPKIELEFGRNRIFEQRIVEAFEGWNALSFWLQTEKRFLELVANTLRVGDPPSSLVNLCDIDAVLFNWSEIDLREIYVNCTEDTQFRIELSWVSPEKFTDNCGKEQDGKSNEPDDPVKDKGLPESGSQPKKNSPSSPFGGNRPLSPNNSSSPYFNPKGDELNGVDDGNFSDDFGYFAEIVSVGKYPDSPINCRQVRFTNYYLVPSGSTSVSVIPDGRQNDTCGNILNFYIIDVLPSGQRLNSNAVGASVTGTIVRAANMPPSSSVFL